MIALLLFAAAHIYSPNFGAFVKTGPGVTLDNSVSSVNTPGSCDFVPAAHPYLKRPEATAFYALFDNYYAHQVAVYFPEIRYEKYTYHPSEGDYYLLKDYPFLTVTTNALFNYSALMSCADRIINATGGYSTGPFNEYDEYTSSSAFGYLGLTEWSNHWYQAVTTLDDWSALAVMGDLRNSSIFHFSTPYNRADNAYWMLNGVSFNEYQQVSNSVPDILYAFSQERHYLPTFEQVADVMWPGNEITQITNRSRSISWKPICAISQTLALMDSYIPNGTCGQGYFNDVKHERYSRKATSEDSGNVSFRISDSGELVDVSAPRPTPHVTLSDITTNITTESSFKEDDWAMRVTSVSHDGSVVCGTNIQSCSCVTIDVASACHYIGEGTNTEFILWLSFEDVTVYFPDWYGYIHGRIDDREATIDWASLNIGDIAGSYEAAIRGYVDASYRYSEDYIGTWTSPNIGGEQRLSCVEEVREYWMSSYACTTNAPMNSGEPYYEIWPCQYIDFGYYPPAPKPTPRDGSMRWGYRKQTLGVWNPNPTTYTNARRSFLYNWLIQTRQWVIEEVLGILGADYRYAEEYLELTTGAATRLLRTFRYDSSEIHYSGEDGYILELGFPITRNGASYSPSEIYFHPSAAVSFKYVSDTPRKLIHPNVGADTKKQGKVKYKMKYPSLRLQID